MSAQPVWITPPGSLGTVPEGTYYRVPLQVTDTTTLSITNIVGNGTKVTISFTEQSVVPFQVGDTVVVANVTPTAYNGSFTVLTSTTTQITYTGSANGEWTGGGTISTIPNQVYFEPIAGNLPSGIECTTDGIIQGVPTSTLPSIRGAINITNAIGDGNIVTLTFPQQLTAPYPVGYSITVSEVSPNGYNGNFIVVACSTNSLSYAYTTTASYLGGGKINPGPVTDLTSKFAIRAYTTKTISGMTVINRLADRTFTMTVAGQNTPSWITPAGEIGQYWNGELIQPGIQLEYNNDNTTGVPPAISLLAGSLPNGLTITDTGLISGYITGTTTVSGFSPNDYPGPSLDNQGFSDAPFDAGVANNNSSNYEFTLQVTNGRTSAVRTFSMYVFSTETFTADTTLITADDTYLTASISNVNVPVLLNPTGSIGTSPNTTFFAYQFVGANLDGNPLGYVGQYLPPGLTLDPDTGWLYGYLPNLGLTEITYNFTVQVYDAVTPDIISAQYPYSLTIAGPISTNVTWLTPSFLGYINNGATSLFHVAATNTANLALQYRLASGSNSRLPQGLTLLPSGNIVGRVSFNTFAIDDGNTTFDRDTTTFDMVYTFVVNAFSINGYISVNQTFSIIVNRAYNIPYNNLYIQAMPPVNDRELVTSLLQNNNIFPQSLIYRPDDYNFGISKQVIYYHAYGLYAESIDTYVASLDLNHYWKNLVLGEIKTAQAVDPITGEVVYEVVYSQIIDDLVNNEGQSVSKEVPLALAIENDTIDTVFPNSLEDMRDQVIDVVGQESTILPLWMQSTQSNGNVLGFTPAWVIAYTIPGASGQIAYNIATQFGTQLNQVDFEVDRYELDNALTVNWDPNNILTLSLTNLTTTGTSVTVAYANQVSIRFAPGTQIVINNVVPSSYNGTYYVTACTNSSTTFASTNTAPYISGGTISNTAHWVPSPPISTTFDIDYHYDITLGSQGANYRGVEKDASGRITYHGDMIKILGTQIGGTSPLNDVLLVVNTVTSFGGIINAFYYGTGNLFSFNNTYSLVAGVNVTGVGYGALWDLVVVPGLGASYPAQTPWINNMNTFINWINNQAVGVYWTSGGTIDFDTEFDGGSLTFSAPADQNTNTDAYNKYLLFPKRNILG